MIDVGGYIGGTAEFVYQRGNWVKTHYAEVLAKKMEELIKVLPHGLYYLTTIVVRPDSTPEVIEKALTEYKSAIASVRASAERYGEELVVTANRDNRSNNVFSDRLSEKNYITYNENNYI